MFFHPSANAKGVYEWCTRATFIEADIEVQAILSYPWLEKAKIGVFPHLDSLAWISNKEGKPKKPHTFLNLLGSWSVAGCKPPEKLPNVEPVDPNRIIHMITIPQSDPTPPDALGGGPKNPLFDDEDVLEYLQHKWNMTQSKMRPVQPLFLPPKTHLLTPNGKSVPLELRK